MLLEERDEPETVDRLCRFLNVPRCSEMFAERANTGTHRKPRRPWWLGGRNRHSVTSVELAALAQQCASSNRRVEQLTGKRLSLYGYPT